MPITKPITYLGRHLDKAGAHPAAALIRAPLLPEHRDAVYARLPQGARHWPLLAKKWKVWAVLAIDEWVFEHQRRPFAPDA